MNFRENESATKLRGGYYTSPDVARFLCQWVLAVAPRRVLEPSCGDGAFLAALAALRPASVEQVVACEIEEREVLAARRRRPAPRARVEVVHAEFLDWFLRDEGALPFDAAVGNPPFIRYQYLDPAVQARAETVFRQQGLRFTKHTNAWVPFVIASLARLRPGGRLGMVVPSELLHILHAQPLRDFLARTCARVVLIDPENLWFDEALQGVLLLLAEKRGEEDPERCAVGIVGTKDRSILQRPPEDVAAGATYTDGRKLAGKWMSALLSTREQALLEALSAHPGVARFADVADVDVGIVTGANHFFLVSEATVERYGLRTWAHPMFGRSEHARGVVFGRADHAANSAEGRRCQFLWFEANRASALPEAARAYIESGEQQRLHTRFKCRTRTPWFRVPSVWASPVSMLKRAHHHPRLLLNRARAFTTDTAYRISPHSVSATALVGGFVNSLTLLSAELEGRHYGGGVLELVPSEIERLPVVTPPAAHASAILRELDARVRAGTDPIELLERQDELVLGARGVSRADATDLRCAWNALRSRRQRRER